MNSVVIVCSVLGTVVAVAGLLWVAYKRGETAGAAKAESNARIEALEQSLADTRRQLAALQGNQTHPSS